MTEFDQEYSTGLTNRRSIYSSVVSRDNVNRLTYQHFSRISQINLPNGNEYQSQEHVPPTGIENQQQFVLTQINESDHISIRLSVVPNSNELFDKQILNKKSLFILYFLEPILSGFLLFPMLVLFWQCGWNLTVYVLDFYSNINPDDELIVYRIEYLIIPYVIVQLLMLKLYLCQNQIYKFLQKRNKIIRIILLKLHIFYLSILYIIQWTFLWTIYVQYIPHKLDFKILLTIASIFILIVLIGHLSDLVCSPFIYSYDSIEYCIHFGCPLLTKNMSKWKINLINYILYEIIISNLSILIWQGFYDIFDGYLYPNDINKSAGISLIIGYILYLILMYFQSYFEELNLKYNFWTFISINFPQFYRNIRHLFSFLSSVLTWRGCWMYFDEYLPISGESYLFFLLLSFIVLSIIQSASSINGPLSHIQDPNGFFPLYPHCYISIVKKKLSKYFC